MVKSIDRLGRNYEEILEQWRIITKEKQAAIVVLDMPLLDTRQNRNLTGTLIADIVLQLLSYVAQTEREFIRQRQAEGIAAAKQNGKRLGRPLLPLPDGYDEIRIKCKTGQISTRQAAQILGMKHSTFYKKMISDAKKCVEMQTFGNKPVLFKSFCAAMQMCNGNIQMVLYHDHFQKSALGNSELVAFRATRKVVFPIE